MSKRGNDPAFPAASGGEYIHGMTIREWYAGQALAGLVARAWPGEGTEFAPVRFGRPNECLSFVGDAVRLADALIAALDEATP